MSNDRTSRYDECSCGKRKRKCSIQCRTCYNRLKKERVPGGSNYERFGRDECGECRGMKSKRSSACIRCQAQPPKYRSDLIWIGVDLDQTISEGIWSPNNPTDEIGSPIPENIRKLRRAHEDGYKIQIYTARPSYQYEIIERWLSRHEIPFKEIHTGKLLLRTLVDDRSTHPNAADWTTPSDPEVAWAAGFFDGEGSVFVTHNKARGGTMPHKEYVSTSPVISLAQVDRRPLDRFLTALGRELPKVRGPYKPRGGNSSPYYKWEISGRPSVCQTLIRLWPFLGEPKKEQAYRTWDKLHLAMTNKSPRLFALPGWTPPEEES